MWQDERRRKSWAKKKSADWDKRAPSFARRNLNSAYVAQFLDHLQLDPDDLVLDVGCGPGTLALPIARKVKRVTALDYSAAMLAELKTLAEDQDLKNLTPIQASWEDDWESKGVPPHDIAIASRSLSVDNLQAALAKLDRWATRAVYISDRVGAGPFDPEIFAAVGRNFYPGPDYIYTLNILYTMGIHARVDFISLDRCREYASPEEAFRSNAWMLNNLTPEEEERLRSYIRENLSQSDHSTWIMPRKTAPKWALICWHKDG